MYSVDLSALHFFQKLNVTHDFFCAIPSMRKYGDLYLNYLHSPCQLEEYDIIVFWGDFTTNPMYGVNEFVRQDMFLRGSSGTKESFARWASLFLPPDADDGKTYLSIGQNFQSIRSFLNWPMPAQELCRRYQRFEHIFTRDSYSFDELNDILEGMDGRLSLGMDCAFLLNPAVKQPNPRPLVYCSFFGRTRFQNRPAFDHLLRDRGFESVSVSDWLALREHRPHWQYRKNLERMRSSSLAVSDTYHFIINAIMENVPVIGLGEQSAYPRDTLSDFKKDILFKDLDLQDYYFKLSQGVLSDKTKAEMMEFIDSRKFASEWSMRREKISLDISKFKSALVDAFVTALD